MLVQSFLVQSAAISTGLSNLYSAQPPLEALVLCSLGVDHTLLVECLEKHPPPCPVYLTETYGILGYDMDTQSTIELMEKGRGSEYGFVGGSGGQGCLVLGFSQGAKCGHDATIIPETASSVLIIADGSKEWNKVESSAPLQYGGITKQCWKVDGPSLDPVPYFWVADTSGEPIGVSTFTGDAAEAAQSLLQKLPESYKPQSIGLFPCFTRGVNQYGRENVESEAIRSVLLERHYEKDNVRLYGMFAHGELGPSAFAGFTTGTKEQIPCEQHSMTSILSMHVVPSM